MNHSGCAVPRETFISRDLEKPLSSYFRLRQKLIQNQKSFLRAISTSPTSLLWIHNIFLMRNLQCFCISFTNNSKPDFYFRCSDFLNLTKVMFCKSPRAVLIDFVIQTCLPFILWQIAKLENFWPVVVEHNFPILFCFVF